CTAETARDGALAPTSRAVVQTEALPIALTPTGALTLRTGTASTPPLDPLGPGDVPVTLRADDWRLQPIAVSGLACVCLRAVPLADPGDGTACSGVIGCGPDGLQDVDLRV